MSKKESKLPLNRFTVKLLFSLSFPVWENFQQSYFRFRFSKFHAADFDNWPLSRLNLLSRSASWRRNPSLGLTSRYRRTAVNASTAVMFCLRDRPFIYYISTFMLTTTFSRIIWAFIFFSLCTKNVRLQLQHKNFVKIRCWKRNSFDLTKKPVLVKKIGSQIKFCIL